jgi:asparagine synthase (glutamine-hydrolysing)
LKGKNGESVIEPLILALASVEKMGNPNYGIITSSKTLLSKDLPTDANSKLNSSFAIGFLFSKNSANISQKYYHNNDTVFFSDGILSLDQIEKKVDHDNIEFAKQLISTKSGPFVFFIIKNNSQIIGRDALGIQPLYFGQTKKFFAFASNRQILWNMQIGDAKFFPPGEICIPSKSNLQFEQAKKFVQSSSISIDMENASKELFNLLNNSIKNNLKGLDKCAIAFSGGLDSTLVALLAKKYIVNLKLIHVSISNNPEIEIAKETAKILKIPIKTCEYKKSDVEDTVSKVIKIIEEPDPIKVSIGIPFFWTAQQTKALGFNTLMAGQGADELFGGYKRYLDNYLLINKKAVMNQMFVDIINMHENNLSRDIKLCNYNGINLLCPFLSIKLIEFAIKLPLELKLEKKVSSLRKLVLRQVALNLGLPSSIVEKSKKAIQYSTGVNTILKKVARNHKQTLSQYIKSKFMEQKYKKNDIYYLT